MPNGTVDSSNDASSKYYSQVIYPTHIKNPLDSSGLLQIEKPTTQTLNQTQNYTVSIFTQTLLWCAQITISSSINRFQFKFSDYNICNERTVWVHKNSKCQTN